MSKDVKVLFWADPVWNLQATLGKCLPTKDEIKRDYIELPISINRTNLDSIFALLNGSRNPLLNIRGWVSKHQLHTSMSVGDIVRLGENDMYISTNLGWKKLEEI
jgi:hypothetical protein